MKKILIVGAGFAGAVIARQLTDAGGYQVMVVDRRTHIAGNCYDYVNEHGIRVHQYGPHLFHTNNEKVFDYLSRFTNWYEYKHKVKALHKDKFYVMPPNRDTAKVFSKQEIINIFYAPYTKKMWGLPIEELNPDIINRVAIRDDDNTLYFPNDDYQVLPENGYTSLFENLLKGIKVVTQCEFDRSMEQYFDHVFLSMPIDEYFDNKLGFLPYRGIKFENINLYTQQYQPTPVINFTTYTGPTRCTEWKHLMKSDPSNEWTTLTYEFPFEAIETKDYFYPVKDIDGRNAELYKEYQKKAAENPKITFIGRCGTYQYLDMHQVINQSLQIAEKFLRGESYYGR